MNEHPLIVSSGLIAPILADRKTQTRRLDGLEDVNNYPGKLEGEGTMGKLGYQGLLKTDYYLKKSYKKEFKLNPGIFHSFVGENGREINPIPVRCPYGKPGDILWVRETWQYSGWTEDGEPWIRYGADGEQILYSESIPESWAERLTDTWADLSSEENIKRAGGPVDYKWRPSIFLPRWASRITLKIKNIRVQRLQEMPPIDAVSEGVYIPPKVKWGHAEGPLAIATFANLWDNLNFSRGYGWESDPWVWVIDFERVKNEN